MIGGHKVGVNVGDQSRGSMSGGQCLGKGVMIRGMRVKVWGQMVVGVYCGGGEVVDK